MTPLLDWLKTKPDGEIKIIIGGMNDSVATVPFGLKGLSTDLAQWVVAKIQVGEMDIRATTIRMPAETIGQVVTTDDS